MEYRSKYEKCEKQLSKLISEGKKVLCRGKSQEWVTQRHERLTHSRKSQKPAWLKPGGQGKRRVEKMPDANRNPSRDGVT